MYNNFETYCIGGELMNKKIAVSIVTMMSMLYLVGCGNKKNDDSKVTEVAKEEIKKISEDITKEVTDAKKNFKTESEQEIEEKLNQLNELLEKELDENVISKNETKELTDKINSLKKELDDGIGQFSDSSKQKLQDVSDSMDRILKNK